MLVVFHFSFSKTQCLNIFFPRNKLGSFTRSHIHPYKCANPPIPYVHIECFYTNYNIFAIILKTKRRKKNRKYNKRKISKSPTRGFAKQRNNNNKLATRLFLPLEHITYTSRCVYICKIYMQKSVASLLLSLFPKQYFSVIDGARMRS